MRIGDGQRRVVMRMDPDPRRTFASSTAATASATDSGMVPPLVSHSSQHRSPRLLRRQQRAQSHIPDWPRNASKKCSRVINHLIRPAWRISRTESPIIARFSSSVTPSTMLDLKLAALAHERHDRGLRLQQRLHPRIILRLHPPPPGHPKRARSSLISAVSRESPGKTPHPSDWKAGIPPRYNPRPEHPASGRSELILQRKIESFPLRPIAQGRVVDFDPSLAHKAPAILSPTAHRRHVRQTKNPATSGRASGFFLSPIPALPALSRGNNNRPGNNLC